jgi:predicted  nucleic acid-binding Zn-ribbon protein
MDPIPITLLGRIYSWLPKIQNRPCVVEEEISKIEVDVSIEKLDKDIKRVEELITKYTEDFRKLLDKREHLIEKHNEDFRKLLDKREHLIEKHNEDFRKSLDKREHLIEIKVRTTCINRLDLENLIAVMQQKNQNSGNYVAGSLTATYI